MILMIFIPLIVEVGGINTFFVNLKTTFKYLPGYDTDTSCLVKKNVSWSCKNIVEELNKKWPRGSDHRTTIEHAGFFTKEQAKLLAKLNCPVSAQPYYNYCLADKYSQVRNELI